MKKAGIVAGFEGDVNTTFFCRVANDQGNDLVTDWRIRMEGDTMADSIQDDD